MPSIFTGEATQTIEPSLIKTIFNLGFFVHLVIQGFHLIAQFGATLNPDVDVFSRFKPGTKDPVVLYKR